MEDQYEGRKCSVQDLCEDLMAESDAEETLSFCDMLLYDSADAPRVSNPNSPDLHEFLFDLALGRTNSKENCASPAEDLFQKCRILPLTESDSNSLRQMEVLLKEEDLKACRSESLEPKSNFWTSSSSNSSQASQRSLNLRVTNSARNKSKGITNWSSFSSGSRCKKYPKWLQFLSFGIVKAPAGMNMEDMRLRQCKRNDNGLDHSVLKRSVSSSSEEGPTLMEKEASFGQKSKSVKENKQAVEAPRTKGFGMFTLLSNYFNKC